MYYYFDVLMLFIRSQPCFCCLFLSGGIHKFEAVGNEMWLKNYDISHLVILACPSPKSLLFPRIQQLAAGVKMQNYIAVHIQQI